MNTKRLTLIQEDGSQMTWTAPVGGRISLTTEGKMACASITNVVGTEVDTICFGKPAPNPASSSSSGGSSGVPQAACGCKA